jgi:A/G-specific adenine glycosylase
MSAENFAEKILVWYKKNRRDHLPWRKTRDPYKILIAEMMLRKTTSKQVAKLFDRFLEKYPSRVSEIEAEITPLGMEHKRALRLKQCAQIIVERYAGEVPKSKDALLSMPGIGDYIANAVLCLAEDKNVALLDTNVIRVLQRFFGITSTKARARTDKALWKAYQQMIPEGKARDFNLAVLDFAAIICTSKNPKHKICPVNDACQYVKARG